MRIKNTSYFIYSYIITGIYIFLSFLTASCNDGPEFKHRNGEQYKSFEKGQTDVNDKDKYGETALHRAAEHNRIEEVKGLLSTPNILVNEKDNSLGYTPLHRAVNECHLEVVKALCSDPRVDINVKNKYGETALHMISANGHVKVTKALLSTPSILVNEKNEWGKTALDIASEDRHEEVVDLLLAAGGMSGKRNDT
ncbi:MAG: ankyrin repeat domain-containing protein [Candidatus Cardinium sp.]|uniref:ankyrin repeat domain-containing protein n=1 Tax=Cardinium endosymbiont of Dermatophagoides farinae TaxID=2597823 RepID=UPI001642EC41|nr:ankyrin repeat domain-containing protein [Cardinium endosymbiont of Dermatophagoides farinae]UWW96475.1 MAG: ankyrin repeat domain-containing protein [Candidatus Cardinium sp.]